jgi:hypothetical protein
MLFLSRTVLKRQVGDAFLQGAGLTAQILHLVGSSGTVHSIPTAIFSVALKVREP